MARSAPSAVHTPCWTASHASLISIATVRATTSPGASPTGRGCQPAMRSQVSTSSRHAGDAPADTV